jgi:hypothetical protein
MKCFLQKIVILLLGGLVPPIIYTIINVGVYDKALSPQGFSFFYLVGILLMIRFGIYGEVSGKINERHKKS